MNKYKLRILLGLLVFVLVCLLIVVLRLEKEGPGGLFEPSGSTPGTSEAVPSTGVPSTQKPTESEAPQDTTVPENTTVETTQETTVETTQETTEATTEATTVETTTAETTDNSDAEIGTKVAALAADQVGKPYKYGGEGPDEFDASGLVMYCYSKQGISVPRSTSGQADFGKKIDKQDLRPGDVVFFWSSNEGSPEYMGIYIDSGKVVAAMNASKPVVEFNMNSNYYTEHYVYARRFY